MAEKEEPCTLDFIEREVARRHAAITRSTLRNNIAEHEDLFTTVRKGVYGLQEWKINYNYDTATDSFMEIIQ